MFFIVPVDLIKDVIIDKIDDGFKVSVEYKEKKYEVFRALSVTKSEYSDLKSSNKVELAKSKDDKRVVIVYSDEEIPEEKSDVLENIDKSIPKIKGNIRIK